MLTFAKNGNPIIEADALITYELAKGPTWHRFFEGLKGKKIYGNTCPQCRRTLVPARSFCPRCFVDMDEWVEISGQGELVGWSLTELEYFGMPTPPPFITGVINLDGADCSFMHLIGGFDIKGLENVRKTVKNGMKVEVAWNEDRTGSIMDIKYFQPIA